MAVIRALVEPASINATRSHDGGRGERRPETPQNKVDCAVASDHDGRFCNLRVRRLTFAEFIRRFG